MLTWTALTFVWRRGFFLLNVCRRASFFLSFCFSFLFNNQGLLCKRFVWRRGLFLLNVCRRASFFLSLCFFLFLYNNQGRLCKRFSTWRCNGEASMFILVNVLSFFSFWSPCLHLNRELSSFSDYLLLLFVGQTKSELYLARLL